MNYVNTGLVPASAMISVERQIVVMMVVTVMDRIVVTQAVSHMQHGYSSSELMCTVPIIATFAPICGIRYWHCHRTRMNGHLTVHIH